MGKKSRDMGKKKAVLGPDISHVKPLEVRNVTEHQLADGTVVRMDERRLETYTFRHGCRHGAPSEEMDVIARLPILDGHEDARNEAIYKVDSQHPGVAAMNRNAFSNEYAHAVGMAEIEYWTKPGNARFVDDKLVKLIYAMAAEEILTGSDIKIVRRKNALAGRFRRFLESAGGGSSSNVGQAFTMLTPELASEAYKARTDRGLKILLDKNIPCNCLAEQKAEAKASPRTRKCLYCKKENVQQKLMKCSRCRLAEYCSKECQKAHWKNHKPTCNPDLKEQMRSSKS